MGAATSAGGAPAASSLYSAWSSDTAATSITAKTVVRVRKSLIFKSILLKLLSSMLASVSPIHATILAAAMQTILVIDDDESLQDTIAVMLEQEGFRVVQARDGKAGYERALTLKPDLLIVDLRLPGMTGVEICKQLRAAQIQTPIIILSAVGEEVDKV